MPLATHRPALPWLVRPLSALAVGTLALGMGAPAASADPAQPVFADTITVAGTGYGHGIGMSHRYLARLHDRLALTGVAISIDLPGFGGLPKPGRDVDIAEMAAALAEVIDDLQVGAVTLVGQSMGTQWVTELAVIRPDLVDRLVLIGPVTDDRARTPLAQSAALTLDTLLEPPGANALVFTDYLRCGPRWYLLQVRHMLAYPPAAGWAILALAGLLIAIGAWRARSRGLLPWLDVIQGVGATLYLIALSAVLFRLARRATGADFGFESRVGERQHPVASTPDADVASGSGRDPVPADRGMESRIVSA